MKRQRMFGLICSVTGLGLTLPGSTPAQFATPTAQSAPTPATRLSDIEIRLLRSLQANPLTAPYGFGTAARGRKIALQGRVGTKQVHDVAIQTALSLGVPVVE